MEAELLIEGGDEMIKSLEILHNRTEQKNIIPKQWQQIIKKSINKRRNVEELCINQRDLFLVNIVIKVYEKSKTQISNGKEHRLVMRNM